jgi:small subunit ribosomal protein S17
MEPEQNEKTEPQVEQVEAQAAPVDQPVAAQAEVPAETPVAEQAPPVAEVTPTPSVTPPAAKSAPAATGMNTPIVRNARKERVGKVTSNKMQRTITVAVNRQVKDARYGKFRTMTKKLTVHDENNDCGIGDTVRVMETRPLSKNKRWRLIEIIERAK